jgi:Glyoxalase-like domain
MLALDHLVVTAATLTEGVQWCEDTLGVRPGPGGKHPLMGTHNRLVKLGGGNFVQAYLEIIAVDPDAPAPAHRRWFDLDRLTPQAPPQLRHLVLRCDDLEAACTALRAAGQDPGVPTAASRETAQGLLQWQITVRADGAVVAVGAPPTLIQWRGLHPTEHLPELGVHLQTLQLAAHIMALPVSGATPSQGAAIIATLQSPRGTVLLHTP